MRIAYADPPYPGQAKRHYGSHADYAGEVDHAALVESLGAYDGWALSTNSKSLQYVLGLCPEGVRVIVWCKRSAPPFPNHGVYGWEPVIVKMARPQKRSIRDWLVCEPDMFTFRPKPDDYVIGQKPKPFCDWLFAWLTAHPDDEFTDLFPGSGSVGRAWDSWLAQTTLAAM